MHSDDLAAVVDKVVLSALPESLRQRAKQLREFLPDQPLRVEASLREMAADFAATATYSQPTTDLYKCVPVRVVQLFMVEDRWKPPSVDPRAFIMAAEASGNPARFVRGAIPAGGVVFPRENSWLIDSPALLTLTSRELQAELELAPDKRPPFVIFHLTVERMVKSGVVVRHPNALDAAAAFQPQWNPGGLRLGQEYLDGAVPIEAVEDLHWTP